MSNAAIAASTSLTEETISARVERLPITSWYRRMMLIVGMAGFFDAFDALTIAFVLPVLIGMWHITPGQIGALISIGYVGQLLGAIFFSWVAEKYGRQRVLRWTIAIIGLLGITCALAWSYNSLFWFRFVQGLGLGAEVPIAATYMNELTKAEYRGRLVVLFQSVFAFGVMITALVSIWVVPHLGWQWMFVIGAFPALLALWLRRLIPESPRWLAAQGRLVEADETLSRIEAKVSKDSALPALPAQFPNISKAKASWKDLFTGVYLKRTLTAWAMALATSIVGYGLLAWLPTIYRTVYHLPVGQALQYSFVSYFVGLFGALSGALLIDRFGRRTCYTVSFVGAAAPLLLLAWIAQGGSAPPSVETVVTLTSIGLFFISILLASLYVYLPEIYPTRMRALGSGIASSWLRIGSIVGPVIVGAILGQAGFRGVFLFFGIVGIVGALVVILFAIETNGKILEEIAQ